MSNLNSKKSSLAKKTGVVVPLGALYTKENPVIGEFADLIPFAKFCKSTGLEIIQLLPVNDTGTQSSPYSGLSAFALHPIYIRLKDIKEFSEISKKNSKFAEDYKNFVAANQFTNRYKYDDILNSKNYFLQEIFKETEIYKTSTPDTGLASFIKANPWVKSYAVYKNLKWKYMQASWKSWDKADQSETALEEKIEALWKDSSIQKNLLFYAWCQQIASEQFSAAVKEVHKAGILLKGDMPILMNEDSCDAWHLPEYFNQNLKAGSPVDGENPEGQNWGFPTYNWKKLKEADYNWWKDRLKTASQYYDAYRLDHILGFFRIWAIPQTDCNAINGHTEPYSTFRRVDLNNLGFSDNRIRWLSQPHVPTGAIEDITWNHETAHSILKLICNQLGNEELWLFKPTVKGSCQLQELDLSKYCNSEAENRIKKVLVTYWSDRTLLEISRNNFIPLWTYSTSTSWKSLNDDEKTELETLFAVLNQKNEKLWKKQADDIFTAITSEIKMIPCGEDLGVGIECVPATMKKHNILGLRVVRWSRHWNKPQQPYVDFDEYEPLSVTTTSVHDSSTIRSWWETEFEDQPEEKSQFLLSSEIPCTDLSFSPEIAKSILKNCSKSASMWYINPLQDYLYMNRDYWLESSEDERINVPGSVNKFNWTYRIPVSLETLLDDNTLIESIKEITRRS